MPRKIYGACPPNSVCVRNVGPADVVEEADDASYPSKLGVRCERADEHREVIAAANERWFEGRVRLPESDTFLRHAIVSNIRILDNIGPATISASVVIAPLRADDPDHEVAYDDMRECVRAEYFQGSVQDEDSPPESPTFSEDEGHESCTMPHMWQLDLEDEADRWSESNVPWLGAGVPELLQMLQIDPEHPDLAAHPVHMNPNHPGLPQPPPLPQHGVAVAQCRPRR